jgi:hypothetical protein
MGVKFTNNAATTLSSGISSGATSFTVAAATDFPTLGVGDWTYVSLTNEVVKVTAISGGTFTCVATSGAHSAGVSVELRMTSELLNDFAEDTESLLLAGGTMTGTTAHGDNVQSTYGASADLLIYHDGSNSRIKDGGEGNLYIQADADVFITNSAGNETKLKCTSDNSVQLFYDNSKKIETSPTGIGVTGNVVVSGTVDGRDVATDGTKLDNIETSATADQTNAEIKTAVQAATSISLGGSPTTTTQAESDDSTKIATTAYVTDKITTLIGGAPSTLNDLNELANAINDDANYNSTLTTALGTKLPLAGGTMTGNIVMGDSVKATFGASADLEIYHDGSNSYIAEPSGTGSLKIRANNLYLDNGDGSKDYIICTNGGAVDLYHNNFRKLITTSTGIDVTGNVAVSGTVDGVDIASRDSTLTSTTTTAGAALPKAGGAMTGDTTHTDNSKDMYGAGNDLQIFHDGAHSNIHDYGTGDLRIRADNLRLSRASDAELYMYCTTDAGVQIYHNGNEKLVTTSTGVQVTGEVLSSTGVFGLDGGDKMSFANNSHIDWNISNATEMRLEADGDLHVDGNVTAYSTTISDERLKENIQPIEDALSKVSQLKGCTFTYTADGRESAGLIAQDVEKVLPSAVIETKLPLKIDDGNEYKVLQYDQTIGLLVEAIKELSAKVEELSSKVE